MHNKKLSIVIPTFNAADLIARCIESVVHQTYRYLEVLVVDGGSTDDTLCIIQNYVQQFDFVRCISEPDRGIYDAMNKGLSLISGGWVYFMGADDQLDSSDVIEKVSGHFESDIDLIYGNILRMTKQRIEGGLCDRDKLFTKNICHQAIFYHKTLLEKVGKFNLDFRIYADWDMNIRCFAAGSRNKYINLIICKYDGRGFSSNSTDHVFNERKHSEISRLYKASYWRKLFRPCRYEFYEKSISHIKQHRIIHAAYYFVLYAYHGLLSKLSSKSGSSAK